MSEKMFKAYDNKNKAWLNEFYIEQDGKVFQLEWGDNVYIDAALCRSTGRMEKDGKSVFEFDILQDYEGRIFLVKWCDYSCGFKLYHDDKAYLIGNVGQLILIGNLFEHKHLLKCWRF